MTTASGKAPARTDRRFRAACATPPIPPRLIPGIPNTATKRTPRDAQEELTLDHDPHIHGSLEIKRQLIDHLQRLRVSPGGGFGSNIPLMRDFPAAEGARLDELGDLELVPAGEIDKWFEEDGGARTHLFNDGDAGSYACCL